MSSDLHSEIMRALGGLEGKVDGINNRLDRVNGQLDKHDQQISDIKISTGKQEVKLGIIGTAGGLIAGAVASMVTGFFNR